MLHWLAEHREGFASLNEPNDDAIGTSTGEHPLLIPEIVENVVKQLNASIEQLKSLRLVSKKWNEAILPRFWRKSGAVLTLVPDPSLFDQNPYKIGIPVSEYLTEFQDPHSPFQLSKKPFAKYKLKDFLINFNKCSELDGEAHKFWTLIGPLMESLHFYKCKFTTPGLCPGNSLKQVVVRLIPNLQHLQLTDTLTQVPEILYTDDELDPVDIEQAVHSHLRTLTVYDCMSQSCGLEKILKVATGLQVITGVDVPWKSSLQGILNSVCRLRFHCNSDHLPLPLSNLKHLDLMNSIGVYDNEYPWRNKIPPEDAPDGIQLPLETLAIHLDAFREHSTIVEDLSRFFNSFSSTLKTLKAFRAPVGGQPDFDLLSNCSMGLLTEMYLWGTVASNFEFLWETPNLKKLAINLGCFEKRDMLVEQIQYHNDWNYPRRKYEKYQDDMALNVREDWREVLLCTGLEYLEIDFEFPEESLRLMGQWMPNLRTLKTILNKETVSVVCEVWGNLTELVCLHGSKIGNGCFVREDEEMAGFSGGAGPKLKICDLDDDLFTYCGEAELTDEVVSNGFLKMTSLKFVDICVNSQMSEEAEEALRRGIQFCKVVRDDQCGGADVDHSGLEAGERSGCDSCDFRRINEIHGFVYCNKPASYSSYDYAVSGDGDIDNLSDSW